MKIRNQTFLKSIVKTTLITKFLHIISWFVLYSSVTGFLLFKWKFCGGRLLLSFFLSKNRKENQIQQLGIFYLFYLKKAQQRFWFVEKAILLIISYCKISLVIRVFNIKGGLLKNYFLDICWKNSVFMSTVCNADSAYFIVFRMECIN